MPKLFVGKAFQGKCLWSIEPFPGASSISKKVLKPSGLVYD